jgi:hypothetical protein
MRLRAICCEVFYREVCSLVAESPNTCDVEFLPKGLHDIGVEKMQPRLQECIDAADDDGYDGIVLAYGLCNNGTSGLHAQKTRIVIPKAHDCISLFMGSRTAYKDYFNSHPGTYYRTSGWYEREDSDGAGEETVSQRLGLSVKYDELVEKYGEENAKYVMEAMGDPTEHYDRIAYIDMGLNCDGAFCDRAEAEAKEKGWAFDHVTGSMSLLSKLLNGEWDDGFVVLEPGQTIIATHDEGVIGAGKQEDE